MSCLNLGKLLPTRKMWKWKVFTNKLQIKLLTPKKTRSSSIKKHKIRSHKSSKRLAWLRPSLSIQPKRFKPSHTSSLSLHCVHKRPPPVYVDQLYVQPVSTVQVHVDEAHHDKGKGTPCDLKRSGVPDQKKGFPEKSAESRNVADDQNMDAADDMWESLVLESPAQMHEIDERAEEFIARFRADMKQQEEMLSRRL